jgi:hypothetical protein
MDRWLDKEVANAEWHIIAGQRHIDRLRHHIDRLERAGYDSTDATEFLSMVETAQEANVHYRDRLLQRLGGTSE